MDNSPVALFLYNRPAHTKQMLASLSKNEGIGKSKIYVFVDGPKQDATESDLLSVREVRELASQIKFGKDLEIKASESNRGLANSIVSGVSQILEKYESVIVIEDDLVLGNGFIDFMNKALTKYANESKIMHVCGYLPELKGDFPEVALMGLTQSWGWGTWRDSWTAFNPDASALLKEIKQRELIRRFNYDGSFKYYRMLQRTMKGKRDSWAIKWYASVFLRGGLALNVTKSLLQNIGHDASGTHSFKIESFDGKIYDPPTDITVMQIEEQKELRKALRNFYIRQKFKDGPTYYLQLLMSRLFG